MVLWELLLQSIARTVIRVALIGVLLPVVLVATTPFILGRAAFLSRRKQQRFRYAVEDGYASVWDLWLGIM